MDEAPVTIWPLPSHVIAVRVHQRAVKAVKRQLRAKGLRPRRIPHRAIDRKQTHAPHAHNISEQANTVRCSALI
jgi:acetyl-CoA acetyltransferase